MAYNSQFEARILNDLAEQFARYKSQISMIVGDIKDLAAPFRSLDVCHYKMYGPYSLKAVLPALVPKMTYKNLSISDGGMAMDAYFRMTASQDPREIKKIRKALLEYCTLDTLAMVKILEKLRELS